jgi:Flp pilus assembly protein TadD
VQYQRFALVVVAALGFSCSSESADPNAKSKAPTQALDVALAAHADGDINSAEALYEKVLDLDEDSKFAMYNLGLIDQTRGQVDAAETRYREALEIDPMFPPALFNLAIIRTGKGDTTEAISLYWKAITVNGDDAGAHLNLGLLLKETGDPVGGDAEINRALELNPALKS